MHEQGKAMSRSAMLVADAQIVLQALSRSLHNMPASSDEALLHLSDLSGLFSAFGLKSEADLLRQLSTRLAQESGDGAQQMLLLMPDLLAIQAAMVADNGLHLSVARKALAASVHFLTEPPPALLPVAQPLDLALAPVKASSPAPLVASALAYASLMSQIATPIAPFATAPNPTTIPAPSTPLFSAGLLATPFAASLAALPSGAAAPQLPSLPDWSELRAQAWHVLQDVSQSLHGSGTPERAEMAFKLSAASDALSRIGQLPLRHLYPESALSPSLWVDMSVAQLLEQLHVFSARCTRISAQQRNQTLFLHWHGLNLSNTESEFLGQKLAQAMGRVETNDQGLQLVLPTSQERMRLVSYRQEDQWRAVSSAQFMGWERHADNGSPQMKLCAGFQTLLLPVQEAGEFSTMNVYPWPSAVASEAVVAGLAIDRAGQLHVLHHVTA